MSDDRPGARGNDPQLVPILVAIAYPALLIALWGFTTLLLDRDFITEPDAGPLLGPAMALAATLVVFFAAWTLRRRRSLAGATVATAASVYLLMLVVGAVGYSTTRGDLTWLVLFTARYALSPFVVGATLLSALTVVFLWAVTVRERRGG